MAQGVFPHPDSVDIDSLVARLTSARATNLDSITETRLARLDATVSSRASATDYTSARAAKLDQIGIKATYRGTFNPAQYATSATATITSVVTSKSQLSHTGSATSSGASYPMTLTNSTTITVSGLPGISDTNFYTFAYELTEWN